MRHPPDSETSLDHTWFRQYSSQFARWTSPDPAGLAAVDPSNPQSWNRYAYVGNNPMNSIDPSGLCVHMLYDDASCFDGGFFGFGPSTTCIEDGVDVGCGSIFGSGGGAKGGTVAVSTWTPSGCVSIDGMSGNTCYPGFWSTVTINLSTGSDVGGGNSQFFGGNTSGGINAPQTLWYKTCTARAIGNGLLHVGIDAIGLIPEGGIVSKAVGKVVFDGGYRGAVAAQQATKVIQGIKMGTGIGSTGVGSDDASTTGLISTGLGAAGIVSTLAGATPVIGQVLSGLSILSDVYSAGKAIANCN
jgi:RHS repeat-associated protein